eukprot:851772-Rhodomonas_salina.3
MMCGADAKMVSRRPASTTLVRVPPLCCLTPPLESVPSASVRSSESTAATTCQRPLTRAKEPIHSLTDHPLSISQRSRTDMGVR